MRAEHKAAALLVVICWAANAVNGFHLPSTSTASSVNVNRIVQNSAFVRRSNFSSVGKGEHVGSRWCQQQRHVTCTSQRIYKSKLFQSDNDNSPSIDPSTKKQIRNIAKHLSTQTLSSLLTKSEATTISNELFFSSNSSPLFNTDSYNSYIKYYDKLFNRLKEENRTPAELLGREVTDKILSTIRGGSYDVETVKAFLESDAINKLFARLLYDAIFEFTTKFDILGNAISNLPLLGPMRTQVLTESKRNMDRTLGPLLQNFLSGYTRIAIRQTVDYVVSPENASSFSTANVKLVTYLLEQRSVSEWIPEDKTLTKWREEIWEYLVDLQEEGKEDQKKLMEQSIDWTYDLLGDKCVSDLGLDVDGVLDASPMLERKLGDFWERCRRSADGGVVD